MKIVWLSHTAELHGAEISLLEAVEGLSRSGHTVHVVVPWDGPLVRRLEERSIPVQILPYLFWTRSCGSTFSVYRKARHLMGHFVAAGKLVSFFRKVQCDIAVTNTLTIPAGAIAAKAAGIPHVWYIHEFGEEDHNIVFQYGRRFSLWLMNALSHRVIVNSESVKLKYQKNIDKGKISLVYYAVQVPAIISERKDPNSELKLILVGRINQSKRQEDAVRALALLGKRSMKVHLTIVGSEVKSYGDFLRKLIADLKISNRVTFLPFTNNPFEYVAQSDIALICSTNEAFGRVTVEAMKMGRPVIGANSGGTTELIKDGWNGFLYHPGDVEELARKIMILDNDRVKMDEMGSRAKTWATERFSTQKYIADLISVFDSAAKKD